MARLEVIKTIEARKLNRRTRLAMSEPPVTIPYGAILDEVVENRDSLEFLYLGELYQADGGTLRAASHRLETAPAVAAVTASAAATPTSPAAAEPVFVWEKVSSNAFAVARAKLAGGWLIAVGEGAGLNVTFYPDPLHTWDGSTR
jgi:hypothetical protein